MSPETLLPKLKVSLGSPSALMRTTVVTAMKFTISDQPQQIDQLLRTEIGHFLATLKVSQHQCGFFCLLGRDQKIEMKLGCENIMSQSTIVQQIGLIERLTF